MHHKWNLFLNSTTGGRLTIHGSPLLLKLGQDPTIVIKQGDDQLGQFPALTVGNILCFGQVSVSPFLMGYCAEQGIGLAFYTE